MLIKILFISLISILIILMIIVAAMNAIRIHYNRLLKNEADRILEESQKNLKIWSDKLAEEQKNLQEAMDIINRDYYEYVIEKRKNKTNTPPENLDISTSDSK